MKWIYTGGIGMEQGSWYTVYYLVSYPLYLYGNNKYRPEQDPCVPIVPSMSPSPPYSTHNSLVSIWL